MSLGALRPAAASIESFIGDASVFDIVGRSVAAPTALVDGLILTRLRQGVSDTTLLNGISIPSGSQYITAAAIRTNVNVKCGTGF